jgi:hypothetical protein
VVVLPVGRQVADGGKGQASQPVPLALHGSVAVAHCLRLGAKRTIWTPRHEPIFARDSTIQIHMLVVPRPESLHHEDTVCGVGDNAPHHFENVDDRRRSAGIGLIIKSLWELAPETWTFRVCLLHKAVAMECVLAHSSENAGYVPLPEVAGYGNPTRAALSTSSLLDELPERRHMTVILVYSAWRQFCCETA